MQKSKKIQSPSQFSFAECDVLGLAEQVPDPDNAEGPEERVAP
jgi:hypothetical protein